MKVPPEPKIDVVRLLDMVDGFFEVIEALEVQLTPEMRMLLEKIQARIKKLTR